MAFTTDGLNELLEGYKTNFTQRGWTLVARKGNGDYITSEAVQFGTISNGTMDLSEPAELSINTVPSDVEKLSLYTGDVTNGTEMASETELVTVTFTAGTYNFTVAGTLTVNSFEISVAE